MGDNEDACRWTPNHFEHSFFRENIHGYPQASQNNLISNSFLLSNKFPFKWEDVDIQMNDEKHSCENKHKLTINWIIDLLFNFMRNFNRKRHKKLIISNINIIWLTSCFVFGKVARSKKIDWALSFFEQLPSSLLFLTFYCYSESKNLSKLQNKVFGKLNFSKKTVWILKFLVPWSKNCYTTPPKMDYFLLEPPLVKQLKCLLFSHFFFENASQFAHFCCYVISTATRFSKNVKIFEKIMKKDKWDQIRGRINWR